MTLGPQTVQMHSPFQGHFLHPIAWEFTSSQPRWSKACGGLPESPVPFAVSGHLGLVAPPEDVLVFTWLQKVGLVLAPGTKDLLQSLRERLVCHYHQWEVSVGT